MIEQVCTVDSSSELTSKSTTEPEQSREVRLIGGLLRNDDGAWREFERTYAPAIRASIGRILRRFSHVATSDAPREVYAGFCLGLIQEKKRLLTFDPARGTRLGSWLIMLAVHSTYDYLRAVKRRPFGVPIENMYDLASSSPQADELCISQQRDAVLQALLKDLTERERQFVNLHFELGLEAEQVASRMGISVKTVYTKRHKLQNKLESMLVTCRDAA